MQAEIWVNKYSDTVVFVGDEYVIYDKCDRLGVEAESLRKCPPSKIKTMDEIKEAYRKNGFKPLED